MESPDRLQCRAYMVATLLRQMALAPEFFEQVWRIGSWSSERAIGGVGVGSLPAPTALNPLTELLTAVEQVRDQLSRSNPMAVHLLRNLGENFYGLVVDSDPDLLPQDAARGTNTQAPGVSQVTLDAIEIIGRLLLDARQMLMHRKNCPVTLCGAPVALQHHSEGPFQAIVPAANEPLRLTPFNMAVADFFGATNVNQQSWTEKDFEPIRRILMEYVLRENGNLQDLGAEIPQPTEPSVGTGKPEASRAVPVQIERRRAHSAPPGLLDELSVVQVVQPIADARVPSHTASADAAQGSPRRFACGGTSPAESVRGTSPEGQGNSEGSKTLATNVSTSVAQQQGRSDVGELGEAVGLPVEYGSTGSTSDSVVIPASSVCPATQKDLGMTMNNHKEDRTDLGEMAEGAGPQVGGASINPAEATKVSGTGPIDADLAPADVKPAVDHKMPMEINRDDQDEVDGSSKLIENRSTLNGPPSDADGVPTSPDSPLSHKDVGLTKDDREENEDDLQKMAESAGPISWPRDEASVGPDEVTRGSGTVPIDDEGSLTGDVLAPDHEMPMEVEQEDRNLVNESPVLDSVIGTRIQNGGSEGSRGPETGSIDADLAPADIEPTADHDIPGEIDQNDQNRANASTALIGVTNTVPQNDSGTSSSSTNGQGPSDVVDIQEIPIATRGLPVRGRPVSGSPTSLLPALPMPGSLPVADQAPTPIADPVRENRKRRCSTSDDHSTLHRPARAFTRSLPPIVLSASPNANEDSVGTAEEGTSQDSTGRRKQRTPRRYTPGPPPASEQNVDVETITRKPGRPRKHRPPTASGASRAGRVSRSRSPPARQVSHPLPTYQKIVKDREARFQKKKTIFLATRGAEHHPGAETHGRKIAEAVMHCSESEIYNHPKLKQIMPHLHTLLFDIKSTGPLPQVKTVKEVKADELFFKWNSEVNGEDDKLEWKELIRKKDPAYEEWWGLAVKVDKEQLEQMELGWITGPASDFGIGEEEDVAGPSGRDFREFSPEL